MMYRRLPVFLCLAVLVGCGGGHTASGGRVAVTIRWPDRSRLIPLASNSITVTLKRGAQVIGSQTLPRPANGNTSTADFNNIKTGSLTLLATAYPNSDGTGVAQAAGTVPLSVTNGQTTNVSLTMNSTITQLKSTPSSFSMPPGGSVALTATAYDAGGSVVITSPSKLSWSSSNTGIALVDANGNVSAAGSGMATITVTDTESGKFGSSDITVAPFVEDFNDNSIDPSLWQVEIRGTGPVVAETNQRLEVDIPASSNNFFVFGGGLKSVYTLKGDFDIQFDYSLLAWPSTNGVRVGVMFIDPNQEWSNLHRKSPGPIEQPSPEVEVVTFQPAGGGQTDEGSLLASANSGRLRMTRVGPTLSGYRWNSSINNWEFLKSGGTNTGDMNVLIFAWSDDTRFGDKAVKVAFDNFIVNSGVFSP